MARPTAEFLPLLKKGVFAITTNLAITLAAYALWVAMDRLVNIATEWSSVGVAIVLLSAMAHWFYLKNQDLGTKILITIFSLFVNGYAAVTVILNTYGDSL